MENKFVLGAIESPVDLRDYDYSMISCSGDKVDIPKEFILDYDYPILNQGLIGSCVAHALSCMKSYIDGVNKDNMYSVGFIYANRREDDFQGTGMITREALKNLVKYGDCRKSSFPVNEEYPAIVETLNKYGKEKLLDEADDHKSLAYISLDNENIKEYLVKYKKPILITVRVYENFYEANSNGGVIPSDPEGNKRGGHAMLCIGYKEDTLIIINSWGDYNGDKGKYYLDINSSIIKELWALEDKKQIKEPEKKKYKVGWNKDIKDGKVKWWFSTDGETYCKEEWKQIKGEYYYFNKNGYALDGEWIQSPTSKKWYYLEKDTCKMLSNCWIKDKGKWYRLEKDGSMLTGWFQDSNSKWYYLDLDQGYMYSSATILIDGKYYSFDSSGAWIEKKIFKGIDVSNNNGSINFNKVKNSGVECVYIKATEGTTFKDGYLDANYSNAKSVGLKMGFYHFLVGTSSPETQATNFYNAIKNKSNDLIPMLDIETNFNGLVDYAERFIKKFKELSNMKVGIYTYTGFLSNLKGKFTEYLLWEANYNNTPWKLPNNSYTRVGHQYTEKGKVNGIEGPVDVNEFTNNIFCK